LQKRLSIFGAAATGGRHLLRFPKPGGATPRPPWFCGGCGLFPAVLNPSAGRRFCSGGRR